MMESGIYVVEEGIGREGLRHVHLLGRKDQALEEEAVRRAEAEGGEVAGMWAWLDEAQLRHVYAVWRWMMAGYPMWVSMVEKGEGLAETAGRAAVNYQRKHGEWPDVAAIRGENGGGLRVEGSELPLVDEEGREVGRLRLEEVGWMPRKAVGVWRELTTDGETDLADAKEARQPEGRTL